MSCGVCGGGQPFPVNAGGSAWCPTCGAYFDTATWRRPVLAPAMILPAQSVRQFADRIDWDAYPRLAEVFRHRPRVNVFWVELERLLGQARASLFRNAGESGAKPGGKVN